MSGIVKAGSSNRGVVVLLVVGLLGLLTVLLLSLNALLRLDVQVGANRTAQVRARAQALAALEIAVGQLQRHVGADTRATANAGDETANPAWVGVWDTETFTTEPLAWLVSGNEDDPLQFEPSQIIESPDSEGADTVWLLNRSVPADKPAWRVSLRPVDVRAHHPGFAGRVRVSRFAYWIGDENQKLSVGEPKTDAELSPDYPRPRLEEVFGPALPLLERREQIMFVDQAVEAGFERRVVRDRWLELTALAWRVGDTGEGPQLLPMGFNVNSTAGADIWRAVMAQAEPTLPSEVRDDPMILEAFYQQIVNLIEATPRPLRETEELRSAIASALPPETDLTAYWTFLEPVLSVRGDTFLIRAYGEALNPALDERAPADARAWLEAVVQRTPGLHPDARFGRAFRVVSLRWLSADDV